MNFQNSRGRGRSFPTPDGSRGRGSYSCSAATPYPVSAPQTVNDEEDWDAPSNNQNLSSTVNAAVGLYIPPRVPQSFAHESSVSCRSYKSPHISSVQDAFDDYEGNNLSTGVGNMTFVRSDIVKGKHEPDFDKSSNIRYVKENQNGFAGCSPQVDPSERSRPNANCHTTHTDNAGRFEQKRNEGFEGTQSNAYSRCGFGGKEEGTNEAGITEMSIPACYIGLIIGRGGAKIKELQQSSGARINVDKNKSYSSESAAVIISGAMPSRLHAKKLIEDLIESEQQFSGGGSKERRDGRVASGWGDIVGKGEENNCAVSVQANEFHPAADRTRPKCSDRHEEDERSVGRGNSTGFGNGFECSNNDKPNELEIDVPAKYVGILIGKSGSKIKELRENSGARIDVPVRCPGTETMSIRISGTAFSCRFAKDMISELVEKAEYRDNNNRLQFTARENHDSKSDVGDGQFNSPGFGNMSVSNSRGGNEFTSQRGSFQDETNVHRGGFGNEMKSFGNDRGGSYDRVGGEKGNSHFDEPSRDWSGGSANVSSGPSRQTIDWERAKIENERYLAEKWSAYPPIKKDFYFEDPAVSELSPEEVKQLRLANNNISVENFEGSDEPIPNPVRTFEEAFKHFPDVLMEIKRAGFKQPSPIQMQAWPIALSGLDLIGIAQTGTGKTLAFILPAFIHIAGQPDERSNRGGPNVLVLSPTRELAIQIEEEVKKYKYRDIKCVCVYGGGNRREQINVVAKGVEIIVATPGRLNDLIQNKIVDVRSVTYLVLDEADRMLDLGFEPEIRKILLDIRPDRQTIMTSATWPEGVRRLATSFMKNPVQVYVGSLDLTAVHSVHQRVFIVDEDEKRDRLVEFIEAMGPDDKLIVFMSRKATVDVVSADFAINGIRCQSIHGSREQYDREQAIDDLKTGVVRVLIATDVASRGIDIKDVTHVLNYDFPHNIEEYVHRVGRTGRAGKTGESITFMTRGDWRQAADLIGIMTEANQEVPQGLYDMADRWERKRNEESMYGGRGGRRGGGGGGGRRSGRRDGEGDFMRIGYM